MHITGHQEDKHLIKLSFTGDVTCDKPLLAACKQSDGSYDFRDVLKEVKGCFSESDCVIGNLETVFGGKSKGYNVRPLGYNSPDSFMACLKKAGFTGFSTANNHCMDEGLAGLDRTIRLLDKLGMQHAGTQINGKSEWIFESKGIRVAVLAYSQSLNRTRFADKTDNIEQYVNLLYPYEANQVHSIRLKILSLFPLGLRESIKRLLGRPTVTQVTDVIHDEMINEDYLERIKQDIIDAKKAADFCIVCVHCGGQFNILPGTYSEYIFDHFINCGADAVIGNHPHIIQKIDLKSGKPAAFSLGGFTLSPSAEYVFNSREILAEYSLIVNLYFDEEEKKLSKVTYSILKGIEDADHKLSVVPVSKLYEKLSESEREELSADVRNIKSRISGRNEDNTVSEEYLLYEL